MVKYEKTIVCYGSVFKLQKAIDDLKKEGWKQNGSYEYNYKIRGYVQEMYREKQNEL